MVSTNAFISTLNLMKNTIIRFYHNPDCSKSRAALALLEQNGFQLDILYYLDKPLTRDEICTLAEQLKLSLREILRKNEAIYKQFNLDDMHLNDEIVLDIVVKHPILLERPIIQIGDKAIIGRPPEKAVPFAQGVLNE